MRKHVWVLTTVAVAILAGLAQAAAAADAGRKKQLDLTYVPGDCFGALVLHPQELVKTPTAAPMLKAMSLPVALDPASIDEVLILFPVPVKQATGPNRGEPSFVVRLNQAANTDMMAKEFLGLMGRRGGTVVEAMVAGKRCYKFEAPAEEPPKEGQPAVPPAFRRVSPAMTCGADDRTVLVALDGEEALKKLLAGGEAKGPLVERLSRADVSHDVVLVFAMDLVRDQLKENQEQSKRFAPPPILPVLETLPLLQGVTITANLNDDTLGKIVLQAVDADGAAKAEEQAKVFQQKLKEEIETARKRFAEMPDGGLPEEIRAPIEKAMALGEKVVNALTVMKTGVEVVITLKPVKGIGPEILEMIGSRAGPRPRTPPPVPAPPR